MKNAMLIAMLACLALALAEKAQVLSQVQTRGDEQSLGPSTKSGELYEHAMWGAEGTNDTQQ